jgi:hypothetical protein
MSSEIEEIVYEDTLKCTHEEFESCHDTFKSVLRKSMVKPNTDVLLKQSNRNKIQYFSRLRSVRQTTLRNVALTMRSGPSLLRWRCARNPGPGIATSKERKSVPLKKMLVSYLSNQL